MQLRNPKDFWAGVLFAGIGIIFALVIQQYEYPLGSARSMGPGRFPLIVAALLTILGFVIIGKSLVTDGERLSKFAWRPISFILGAVVLFGLLVKTIGLVFAIIMLVLIAGFGGHEFKLKEQLISAVVIAVFCVMVFVKGLGLAFPIWPAFIN